MRYLAIGLLLLMAATSSGRASECFCLAHPVNGSVVRYGCTAISLPDRVSDIVRCLTPERRGPREIIDGPDRWLRLADGEGACNPCAPGPDEPLPDVPRDLGAIETGE